MTQSEERGASILFTLGFASLAVGMSMLCGVGGFLVALGATVFFLLAMLTMEESK